MADIVSYSILGAGAFAAFALAVLLGFHATRSNRRQHSEFDGGYRHDHSAPPVRTVIWSKDVIDRKN